MEGLKCLKDLPPVLKVKDIMSVLDISQAKAYEIVKQKNFPAKRLKNSRLIRIPRDEFIKWFNDTWN